MRIPKVLIMVEYINVKLPYAGVPKLDLEAGDCLTFSTIYRSPVFVSIQCCIIAEGAK